MTKSAGWKTYALRKSSTARSTYGRSGSSTSKMNFDKPSLSSCMILIVGSYLSAMNLDPKFAFERGMGAIQHRIGLVRRIAVAGRNDTTKRAGSLSILAQTGRAGLDEPMQKWNCREVHHDVGPVGDHEHIPRLKASHQDSKVVRVR
jgi:hypothetical protein